MASIAWTVALKFPVWPTMSPLGKLTRANVTVFLSKCSRNVDVIS